MKFSYSLTIFMMLLISVFTATAGENEIPGNAISLKGTSDTRLGDYQIKEVAPVTLNGVSMRTFVLSYQNVGNTVMIYLNEREDCRDYIVRSKNLEVKYVCSKSSFGAKLVTGKFRQYDPAVNASFLSKNELAKQEKIADGGLEIPSALGLIAGYYPALFSRSDLLD